MVDMQQWKLEQAQRPTDTGDSTKTNFLKLIVKNKMDRQWKKFYELQKNLSGLTSSPASLKVISS
jgi:hypothetical protein